jgi:N-acetylglucosaminyl-diphospho-decaprenol L-rhamnosyltransferase
VVIVNYESGPALARCVEGWQAEGASELVVVDNGSVDGSVDEVPPSASPTSRSWSPGRNLGYGAAANRGVAATTEPHRCWCATPTSRCDPGALASLAAVLADDPGCALVGPLIRTPRRRPAIRRPVGSPR